MKKNLKTEQKKEICVQDKKGQVKASMTKGNNIVDKTNAKIFEKATGKKVSSYNKGKLSEKTLNKAYGQIDKSKYKGRKK